MQDGCYPRDVRAAVAVDVLTFPADRVRLAMLRALGPVARRLVRDRELRVAMIGTSVVVVSLLTTLFLPWWTLALGPVLFGATHVLADLRYLVFQPRLHKRWLFWLLVVPGIVWAGSGGGMKAGALALAGAAIAARTTMWKRAAIVLVAAGLFALSWEFTWVTDLVFAHAHNFIAVVLWWAWRPRGRKLHWVPLTLFVVATAAVLLGATEAVTAGTQLMDFAPEQLGSQVQVPWLAWGVTGPLALRLTLLFAFAQSVHYGVWLRLVPEEGRGRETTRTFGATVRALVRDLGWPVLLVFAVIIFGLAGWAAFDVVGARHGYLRFAMFHGHMELVAVTVLFVERTAGRGLLLAPLAPRTSLAPT